MLSLLVLAVTAPAAWQEVWRAKVQEARAIRPGVTVGVLDAGKSLEIVTPTKGGLSVFDPTGHRKRVIAFPDPVPGDIVIGKHLGKSVFVATGVWDHEIVGRDSKGKTLWRYETPSQDAVDDVCAVPLPNGDVGFGVGYNGGGGVRLISADGKPLWHAADTSDTWSVGCMRTKSGSRLLAVGADNGVPMYGMTGKLLAMIPDPDAGAVSAGDLEADGNDEPLTLGTTVVSGSRLRAWTPNARKLWGKDGNVGNLFNQKPILVGRFVRGRTFVVVGAENGFKAFDAKGNELPGLTLPGTTGIAALPRKSGGDLLLVRRRNALVAYSLQLERQ